MSCPFRAARNFRDRKSNNWQQQCAGRGTELADATMPVPPVSSVNVSTPERRLAVSALDVAQTAQRDMPLAGQPSNSWMANELRTLERAAQSVLNDDGSDQEFFTTKLYTFWEHSGLRREVPTTSRGAPCAR